ncbi:hypothetical protein AB0F03_10760 [Streptomyces sp. NPDC028722]|uniref:hypothetical protein n=1 Tax=Streptomyces sp. NPDC028722 TaxID=3155016 RepID=UPI0033D9A5C7
MEQRIGASSKPSEGEPLNAEPSKAKPVKAEPVTGAGFDPAFIPGITGPSPAGPPAKDSAAGKPEAEDPVSDDPVAGEPVAGEPVADDPVAVGTATDAADGEQTPEGPVFEASDRRARIVADHRGVRLRLDEEDCEFGWDEIAAVETESPRFGKRFTVTVHTPDRRWYPIEIEATARARFTEWESALDAVLDAYFEEA